MPLMKVMPSTGASFCSPSHFVQRQLAGSCPGFGNILTIWPLIGPVPVRDAEPAFRLTGVVALFPKARSGRLCRASRVGHTAESEQQYKRQSRLQVRLSSHATTSSLPIRGGAWVQNEAGVRNRKEGKGD